MAKQNNQITTVEEAAKEITKLKTQANKNTQQCTDFKERIESLENSVQRLTRAYNDMQSGEQEVKLHTHRLDYLYQQVDNLSYLYLIVAAMGLCIIGCFVCIWMLR